MAKNKHLFVTVQINSTLYLCNSIMENLNTYTNRLTHASSPYLLQHAHNPVDWHEWGEEAFEKARKEDKLVLVSIGYSACHWCHVMERECFEKEDTAAIMNKHFVCIKVDREERPDIDQIYMDAVQLLTGRGGWPLNCFTLPDGRPLHGGTYFPKAEWEKVLKSLADFYANKREEAMQYANDLTNGIKKLDIIPQQQDEVLMGKESLDNILNKWSNSFDTIYGGYTWAPKFPLPSNHSLFLQYWYHTKNQTMLTGVHTTLTKMAEGGIFDQVGGGFARYSTDSYWKVPHFEKMLYDNAQLLSLYSDAYAQSKNKLYKDTVYHIHQFISSELTSPEGFYYSALDADSEGVEGKYYIWTQEELKEILGNNEPVYSLYYSVDAYGNWEHGSNILYKTRSDVELESLTGRSIKQIEEVIKFCNKVLLAERNKRIKPGLDDKMITSWNALMIKGYTDAFKVFNDRQFLNAAIKCADVIMEKLIPEGRLHRIYKNGKTTIPAFAEDYAYLTEALINLSLISGEKKYINEAARLMEESMRLFFDSEIGYFRFKANDGEQLISNKLDLNDDVIPASNSVFAKNLLLLGYLYENNRYLELSKNMVANIGSKMEKFPNGYANWMQLLLWMQYGFYQIICTGEEAEKNVAAIGSFYHPSAIIINKGGRLELPLIAEKSTEKNLIYICVNQTCGLPVSDIPAALELLK